MSLVRFNKNRFPWFDEAGSNWLDVDDFFSDDFFSTHRNLPKMNVKENELNFEVALAVPGFSKDEIEVLLEQDVLKVKASKQQEDVDEQDHYTRREFNYNSFERSVRLPEQVNKDQEVSASYEDGILKLTLNKKEPTKTPPKRKIEIA